jgi:uncharacterized protein YjbI with pentapeptide repeats
MSRWIASSLRIGLIGFVSVSFIAISANAATISPFTDHTGEAHSRATHVGEYLEGAILTLANLTRSDFSGSDLTDALLDGANLERITMTGADLTGADLMGALASRGNFTDVDFSGANMEGADFSLAIFTGASFTGATYDAFTVFDAAFDPVAAGMNFIPEPNTASLVALGLLGLASYRRRISRSIHRG